MEQAKLTFRALNDRIEALPEHPSMSMQLTKKARWGYIVGVTAGFVGIAGGKLLPDNMPTLVFVSLMLAIELIALAMAVIPPLPWRMPGFAAERREYADQLDFEMPHHAELIEWLGTFPKDQLETMAEYAAHRHERLKDKLPLLTGSLEKLGALPIVIALFIQFKDLHWPPQPSWPEIIFGFALVLCYWSSLMQVSLRFRIQLYEILLKQAASERDDGTMGNPQSTRDSGVSA